MKQLSTEDITNWWLEKFHKTNLETILKENPEWEKDPDKYSRVFFEKYEVTQKQYDEWVEWLVTTVMKENNVSREFAEKNLWVVKLNNGPNVKFD